MFHRENEIRAIDFLHSEQSFYPHRSFRYAALVAAVCVDRLHVPQAGQFLAVVVAAAAALAESPLL